MAKKTTDIQDIKKPSVDYIRGLEGTLRQDIHATRLREQQTDQDFYDEKFQVAIEEPYHIVRTGSSSKMVDLVVEHIETANPQAFREARKPTDKDIAGSKKVAKLVNYWLDELIPEIDEGVRNQVHRGEAIFHIWYDENDAIKPIVRTPDPINVFCVPHDTLVPNEVVLSYEMDVLAVKALYPEWEPKDLKAKKVKYLEYWNADWNYVEADEKVLLDRRNYLGFVPFVHCFSGFGKRSPEGKPESLSVGRLRKHRGVLIEECELESSIDSIIRLYANPVMSITQTEGDAAPADKEAMAAEVYAPGVTLATAYGYKREILQADTPSPQMFQHLYQIKQRLGVEIPPVMLGLGMPEGGRSQDVAFEHVEKKYAKLIKNLTRALTKLMSMGLEIFDKTPQALPISVYKLTKEDLGGYYDIEVQLNPEEAIEHDRKVMMGRILVNEGRISWKRFLTEFMGKTEDEADDIITDTLAEQHILTSPAIRGILDKEAMIKMGMGRYLKEIQEDTQMQAQMQEELAKQPAKTMRPSEARNPLAVGTLRGIMSAQQTTSRESPVA